MRRLRAGSRAVGPLAAAGADFVALGGPFGWAGRPHRQSPPRLAPWRLGHDARAAAAPLASSCASPASRLRPELSLLARRSRSPSFPPIEPPRPIETGPNAPDLAYGAFQRGRYLAAFDEATKRVADSKDPIAMTLLGMLYSEGLGVPRDLAKAAAGTRRPHKRGNRDAVFAYGMMKLKGEAIPRDETGAVLLLNRAADMKVAAASYNLGILALRPTNGQPDFETALKRFREAAALGSADGHYSVGILLKEGKGTAADPNAAAAEFLLAAREGIERRHGRDRHRPFQRHGDRQEREGRRGMVPQGCRGRLAHRPQPPRPALCVRKGRDGRPA